MWTRAAAHPRKSTAASTAPRPYCPALASAVSRRGQETCSLSSAVQSLEKSRQSCLARGRCFGQSCTTDSARRVTSMRSTPRHGVGTREWDLSVSARATATFTADTFAQRSAQQQRRFNEQSPASNGVNVHAESGRPGSSTSHAMMPYSSNECYDIGIPMRGNTDLHPRQEAG